MIKRGIILYYRHTLDSDFYSNIYGNSSSLEWNYLQCKYLESNFTATDCVTFATVVWMWLSNAMVVYTSVNDSNECSYWMSTAFCCNNHCQTSVINVTLPAAAQKYLQCTNIDASRHQMLPVEKIIKLSFF